MCMPELDIGMQLNHGFKSLAKDKLNKMVAPAPRTHTHTYTHIDDHTQAQRDGIMQARR